ncbi:MAG: ferredoxin, partial [Bacteroides sp.]|nr:ferredoxin [Bacteroides sp.]
MILNERDIRNEQVLRIGMQMMTAARTAPKGKGVDVIEVAMLTGEDIKRLSDMMIAMYGEHGMKF